MNIAPHVAQNTTNRASASDGRTTRHPGYAVSQIIRKRIEESFAWTKTIAGLHKTKHRGVGRVAFQFVFAMAAYNLIRTIDRRLRPIICQKQTIKLIQPIRSGIQCDATKENTALLRRQVQRRAIAEFW